MILSKLELVFYTYIILMNLIALLLMYIDKNKAKKKRWRISENLLISIGMFGGSFGILVGMIFYRHKISKSKFKYGVPVIYLIQRMLIILITHTIGPKILEIIS